MSSERWYPDQSVFGSHEAWNAHKRALDMIYDLQGQVKTLKAQPKAAPEKQTGPPKEGPGSYKETYVAGLLVQPGVPSDGQKLTYKAATGQLVFE